MSREKLQNCKLPRRSDEVVGGAGSRLPTLTVGTSGKILAGVVLAVTLFALSASFARAESNDPFLLRALVLADFRPDEVAPTPEISYLLPGEQESRQSLLDPYTKVVTIFDPAFGIGGVQAVFRAPVYQITDADKTFTQKSFKRGVGGVIADAGIVLAKEDKVEPALSSPAAGNSIKITRVSVAEIEEFETLPYQTKEIDDPDIDRGIRKVTQDGKTGTKTLTYQVRRENGIEVSKDLIKSEVTSKPEDKIIKIGTRVVVLSSVRGYATITPRQNAVVSANYKRGTLLRITNTANGVSIFKTVNYTWGTASAPEDVVLDLSVSILDELKFNGKGKGPVVLVEEIKQ